MRRGAANKAGFSKVELIEEGVAAALAHNIGQDTASCHNGTILIYDAGAHKVNNYVFILRIM
jgi:molecular chaperone DnaK (HSP70)